MRPEVFRRLGLGGIVGGWASRLWEERERWEMPESEE
jgi:hypothetical protein